jgi:hypothetical protein
LSWKKLNIGPKAENRLQIFLDKLKPLQEALAKEEAKLREELLKAKEQKDG